MKIYKKVMKSFGGAAIYLDKTILNHLGILPGDEIVLELKDDKIIMTKSGLDIEEIQKLIDRQSQKRD